MREQTPKLTDEEQRELGGILAQLLLPSFTVRETEIATAVASAALAIAREEHTALSARCRALEQERDHLQEELGIHVDLTIEPFTEAELAQVDALRAKMRRTVEEYDITKAVERAERAEAERDEAIKGRDEADAIIARYGFGNAELTIKNLESRCQHLGQAVRAFLAVWPEAEKAINGAIVIANIHGLPYSGPSIRSQLDGLKAALASHETPGTDENRVSFAAGYTAALDDALKGTK